MEASSPTSGVRSPHQTLPESELPKKMEPLRVVIIGAGLSGLLLANGLVNKSSPDAPIDVSIYERDSAEAMRGGYQIRLGSHALTGFRACLTPEQFDAILARFGRSGGAVSSAPVLFDKNLNIRLDLRKFPAYTKSAPINRAVLRNLLRVELKDGKTSVHYCMKFIRYEVVPRDQPDYGAIRAFFEDGSSVVADVLVAADGNKSRSNEQVGCRNIVDLTRREGALAKADLPWSILKMLPQEIKDCGTVSCIADQKVFFAAVYLPDKLLRDREANPHLDDTQNTYDEEEASLMVGLSWVRSPPTPSIATVKGIKSLMLSHVKSWHPGYSKIIEVVNENDVYIVNARASNPLKKTWRRDAKKKDPSDLCLGNPRIWLLGDAIHPMLPSRGMGANQALHDCADALPQFLKLAEKKRHSKLSEKDFLEAVTAYEEKMMPRSFAWVAKSGGTSQTLVSLEGWRGKLGLFVVAQVLNVAGALMWFAKCLGWKAKDDAPELP